MRLEMGTPEKELLTLTPAEAVAEAMMVATFQICKYDWPILLRKGSAEEKYPEEELRAMMREASVKWCKLGSGWCLRFLSEKYPEQFSELVMIESWSNGEHKLKDGWLWHCYFLARGIDDVWYAGSPGNFDEKSSINRLTNVFADKNLKKVIRRITEFEGGEWPKASSVEMLDEDFDCGIDLKRSGTSEVLECLCVSRRWGSDVFKREKIGLI